MKKLLTVLFGLLFWQNAYCDSIFDTDIKSEILDYMEDKMDDNAIRALCEKLLNYAQAHNFDITLEYGDNKMFFPSSSDCKEYKMNIVSWILEETAKQLSQKTFEKHSKCAQNLMKENAFLQCEGFQSPRVREYENKGIVFDFTESNTIIDCSETDNRCVVNRPIRQNGSTGYYSVCCSVPVYSCDDRGGSLTASGDFVNVQSSDFVGNARTLKDFDYACQPINSGNKNTYPSNTSNVSVKPLSTDSTSAKPQKNNMTTAGDRSAYTHYDPEAASRQNKAEMERQKANAEYAEQIGNKDNWVSVDAQESKKEQNYKNDDFESFRQKSDEKFEGFRRKSKF